jgi:uncharacterized protein (TIGR04255 family)
MSWKIPDQGRRFKFERNTLRVVVAQVLFVEELTLNQETVEAFHGLLGAEFSKYKRQYHQELRLHLGGDPSPGQLRPEEPQVWHIFEHEGGERLVILHRGGLTLEERSYERLSVFRDLFVGVLGKLRSCREVPRGGRLGLRFINIIDKDEVERDLGEAPGSMRWGELIHAEFLRQPMGLIDVEEGDVFFNEISSTLVDKEGALTLRYGLLPREREGVAFRYDMDRYVESEFDMDEVPEKLYAFGISTASMFDCAVGPRLREWMKPTEGA